MRKWSNKPNMSKVWPLTLKKQPFERFNQILLIICCLCHPKEASWKKMKKSYGTVFEKTNFKVYPIWSHVNFLTPKKKHLQQFSCTHFFIVYEDHPKEDVCLNRNKRPPGLIAPLLRFWHLLGNPPKNTTKVRDLLFNRGLKLLNMADTSLDRFTWYQMIQIS